MGVLTLEKFIIGKTRNGVIITSESYADGVISLADMYDALAILESFCVRELHKNGKTELFENLYYQSKHWYNKIIENSQLPKLEQTLNIDSYAARIEFGKRLLKVEFRD